jgi:hypothetical protein
MIPPDSNPPQSTAPSHRKRIAASRVELTVLREAGTETSRTMVLDGERFQLGSHPKNDLVLEDPSVCAQSQYGPHEFVPRPATTRSS